ncbi:Rpn family recombination-promoting nuclease/putative transposase [Methylomicrobium agile]|uniref:Rpn family recombination-promoting nuclease/putative transposase n=1 Tax=Methylomicrobium agile TaxID=39774 RepID=UPI000A7177D3|nr:Rpn family recombination-promoting nuclease/putative transposase [Methylomicrobium agile]
MNPSHDHSYKLLFSEPEIIRDLLQGFVHEPWVGELDFSTLESVATSYVTDDLRHREDDVIWRVKSRHQWIYVYLLIEFQSTVDHYMAVRLMSYIGLLYQDLIKTRQTLPDRRLPPVFPVVLYNGDRRWRAPTELAELIATLPGGLARYRPTLRYLILDEGAYDLEALDPLPNLVAAIFRLEHHREPAAILEVISNLIEWLAAPEQTRLRRSFSVWINRVLHAPGEDRPTEPNDLREIKTMLAQRIPQWLQEARLQGEAQGEARGKPGGRLGGKPGAKPRAKPKRC